jgi:hypothetical protein
VQLHHLLPQTLLQRVPHQERPLRCDLSSLYLKPFSILLLHEYPLASRLVRALAWAEVRRHPVVEGGRVEAVPLRFVKAWAAEEEVQSREALGAA